MKCLSLILMAAICGSLSHGSDIQEVEEFLSAGEQMDFKGSTDFVLLLGSTGVGKSTLAKFITHDETLNSVKFGRKYIFQDNGTISTVTSKSMTLLPNVYQDPETGQVVIDCPGFSDTRESKFEIAASYYVKKILESAKNIKIILVENIYSLEEGKDRHGFRRLLIHLSELIPNIERFHGKVTLIANKVEQQYKDEEEKADLLEFLKKFRNDTRMDIADESELNIPETADLIMKRDILRVLNVIYGDGNGTNLGLFRAPKEPGSPWQSDYMMDCYRNNRDLIFHQTPWVDNTNQTYRFTLTTNSKLFIRDQLVPANNVNVMHEISKTCSAFISAVDYTFSNSSLSIPQKLNLSNTLKTQFQNFSSSLESLNDLASVNEMLFTILPFRKPDSKLIQNHLSKALFYFDIIGFKFNNLINITHETTVPLTVLLANLELFYDFLEPFEGILDDYKSQSQRFALFRHVSNSIEFREFLLELSKSRIDVRNKLLYFDINISKFMADDFNQIMQSCLNYTVNYKYNNQSKHLLVVARNYLINEIHDKVNLSYPNVNTVNIIAAKTIFIDRSLHFSNIHLNIIAPKVKIIGHQEITMKGNDAAAPVPSNAADSTTLTVPGEEGRAGYPGFNAGNFLMLALDVVSPKRLIVTSIGGQGGQGQIGGNGSNGLDSAFPDLGTFIKRSTIKDVRDSLINIGTVTHQNTDSFDFTRYSEGVPPSGGGNGGVGGPGGHPGHVILKVKNYASSKLVTVVKAKGKKGEDGDGGIGGIGMSNCVKTFFICQKHLIIYSNCSIMYLKSCSKSWEYRCYPKDLGQLCENTSSRTNGIPGKKGGSLFKPADHKNYPLESPTYKQLWTDLNKIVGANQTIEPEFNMLHLYAQESIKKNR